jgi:hypothetical protein
MNGNDSTNIINLLLSGLMSGVVVAALNYFLTRSKTKAEIEKLKVEAEKIRLEAEKMRKELSSNVESIASAASYQLSTTSERVIYDSKNREIGFDFEGLSGYTSKYIEGNEVYSETEGTGTVSFNNGIINIQRTNTDGRYELWLNTYIYPDGEKSLIPKDELIAGQRRFRISCEVKVVGGEHTLEFVFKGLETADWLAYGERRVTEENWIPITMYFLVSAKENCQLRIDDQEVSQAQSSIQIRNFVLAEKVS